jgi:hypothetical protein
MHSPAFDVAPTADVLHIRKVESDRENRHEAANRSTGWRHVRDPIGVCHSCSDRVADADRAPRAPYAGLSAHRGRRGGRLSLTNTVRDRRVTIMEKRSDDLQRDVEALVQQSDRLLEYARDLMNEAARIRGEAARLEGINRTEEPAESRQ